MLKRPGRQPATGKRPRSAPTGKGRAPPRKQEEGPLSSVKVSPVDICLAGSSEQANRRSDRLDREMTALLEQRRGRRLQQKKRDKGTGGKQVAAAGGNVVLFMPKSPGKKSEGRTAGGKSRRRIQKKTSVLVKEAIEYERLEMAEREKRPGRQRNQTKGGGLGGLADAIKNSGDRGTGKGKGAAGGWKGKGKDGAAAKRVTESYGPDDYLRSIGL